MASPLLDTKFHAPRPRSGIVARPLLSDRLERGARSRLTLVSAPAGFGKSTLVAEWLAALGDPRPAAAWLSLDPGDNHPVVFWTQVIAALQTAIPGVGAGVRPLLDAPDPSIDSILPPLLNDLNASPSEIVLVLDDYHVIEAPAIQLDMAFMLDHLPANVHLVMTTRADPALPLARLRARGELVEIRAADLRFTPGEATAYLNDVMMLGLSDREVATLDGRTEGWIAALQLAGLSMQGRDDVAAFIAEFAGDDRYIVDYLVEEVWQRQPDDVRDFLLQTSILARMTGPLCDAVTGQQGGRATLEALDRRNLFLIPLDDRRRWYRYHHLFADVLQARLLDERADLVPELHRRATEWFARQGEYAEAINHAFAGKDVERAADLVELAIPASKQARQDVQSRRWMDALPAALIRMRPVLSDSFAASRLVHGEVEGVDAALRDAEGWVAAARDGGATGMVVVDESAFRDLPASIAIHRAGLARLLGDVAGTMVHARAGLELVREDDRVGRAAAEALLGLAYWSSADLEAASRLYVAAIADLEGAGYLSDVVGCSIGLADMRLAQGRLSEAMRILQRGLELATPTDGPALRGAADMHVGLCGILRERDDRVAAAAHLAQARTLGEEHGLPQNPYRSRVAAALLRLGEGDADGALELLDDAARRYDGDFSPEVRPVAALRARVLITQGRLAEARTWAHERGLAASDELDYVREFDHITLARLLVAEAVRDGAEAPLTDADRLLARLLDGAEAGGRMGSVIDILAVHALARHARGDVPAARTSLARAADLAEPEGYIRIFVDHGAPMTALLGVATKQRDAPAYLRRLLAATVVSTARPGVAQPLIEPLSDRELQVLRLLASDLDGPDIARDLSVSLPTVRTHTSNIYAKLGVTNRRAAVSRATELDLLTRRESRPPTA
jgi:LuxR family maltose regulon positive regulatory protein